jgi:hypothetical protein
MSRATLGGAVIAFAVLAAIIFVGVAVHELSYASGHPYAYGPAKVIAWAGAAGALLALAVTGLAVALLRREP